MKTFLKITGIIAFIGLTALILIYTYAFLHPLKLDEQRSNITIYDVNGNVMYESNFMKNMTWTDISEIPQIIQDSFVSVEDKRFYNHVGFDPIRMGKAVLSNLRSKDIIEGGSTITQQYAKNLFLTNEQTWSRKIQEFFYAARLEMQYGKDEILEGYLNTIYFGHGVYGIKSAASYFFGKEMQDLSIAQLAMLIGIPNGPSIYSPYISMENAVERQHLILQVLEHNGIITEEEKNNAMQEKITLVNHENDQQGYDEYYINAVIQDLSNRSDIDMSGTLHVYTYYDSNVQNSLQKAISAAIPAEEELEVSAVVLQPFTGSIMAIAGGKDYTISQYNRALNSQRQVASTIKPLLYYTALLQGFTPSSTFISQPTTFRLEDNTEYAPENYNSKYPNREISMINAISMSDNIYAVKTHLFLGTATLHQALLDFGITQSQQNPSEALGTVNMSILELSKIYNTFASEGLYIEPAFISRITDGEDVLYERKINPKRLLERNETLILSQMLTATYDSKNMTFSYPTMAGYAPDIKVAVKSGTSDWDALVVGYTPEYTVGIWNGFDDNRELSKEYYDVGKVIFKSTFNSLYENKSGVWYQPSEDILVKMVDPISGEERADGSEYWYLK
ncbi:MAG: penicillin-binding protein [Erysipelotrichaceae bacterium]|jgi:membrane peptidoglycan carboxypeptidase|nr:penicillin-binding protein [Erysipelotrichaceae bacterium]